MSLKLLKQSMDIVQDNTMNENSQTKKGKDVKTSKSKLVNNKSQEQLKQRKHCLQKLNSEGKTISKKSEDNIKRLLALSMNTVKIKDAEKIVQRAHKGRYVEKIIPKVEQESIFTEEDFRKFEEEYFNS